MLLNSETTTCEAIQTHLVALLDNELSPEEATYLRSHLAVCPACSEAFDQIRETTQAANAWAEDGSDIWQALEKRLASEADSPLPVSTSAPGMTRHTRWLSELLRAKRVITAEELAKLLDVSKNTGRDLAHILVDLGYAGEREMAEWRAKAEGLQFIDLTKHKPEESALFMIPSSIAQKYKVLPMKKDGSKLWVAMANPRDTVAVDNIRMVSRSQVAPLCAFPADLERAIAEAYPAETENPSGEQPVAVSQEDLRAVLTEMRALRTEIQELRGEVGTLRRLLSATQQITTTKSTRPLPPEWMPIALPESSGIGLL